MRTFFLLHDDWYQYEKADYLASLYPIDGFVVIKRKRAWWGKYLAKRMQRIGMLKVLDELALRAWLVAFHGFQETRNIKALLAEVKTKLPADYVRPPVTVIESINSKEGQATLRALKPDVCILMVHPILSKATFSIPTHGMLVFHPGVTPEYRGPHSAFWALMNNEIWGIGWSLLRVDEGIDTGPVIAQGSATSIDPLADSYLFMQHKSHIDGTPHVADVLRRYERGEQPSVVQINRRSTNYTHPGITDYLRLRAKMRALRAGTAPQGEPKPPAVM